MCGIFGYFNFIGVNSQVEMADILTKGLKRLEYRGYDSCGGFIGGIPCREKSHFTCKVGSETGSDRIDVLKQRLYCKGIENSCAQMWDMSRHATATFGHTRWATHGKPSQTNAHPHWDRDEKVCLVHNGMISNYAELKELLLQKGYNSQTDTDTEVIANLLSYFVFEQGHNLTEALARTTDLLVGTYALIGFVKGETYMKDMYFVIRRGSPVVIGWTSKFCVVSSDAVAISDHTDNIMAFEEEDSVILISRDKITMPEGVPLKKDPSIRVELEQISKGKYDYFMQKEIYEQPSALENAIRGRIGGAGLCIGGIGKEDISRIKASRRIILIACGTSHHACLATRSSIEKISGCIVSVESANDFLDQDLYVDEKDTCVFVSQSGETADTLKCLSHCLSVGALCIGITNTVGSNIARKTKCGIYCNAGPEIGVASTKAYTTQIACLLLFAIRINGKAGRSFGKRFKAIPEAIRLCIGWCNDQIKQLARELKNTQNMIVIGRGREMANASEACLKIKEIAYVHAEAIQSGELKHGPLALVDKDASVFCIATRDENYDKTRESIEQIASRGGHPIVVCFDDQFELIDKFQCVTVPDCGEPMLQCIINIVPFQLLSFYLALEKGLNVDKPRNLAKSVTV